MKNYIVIKMEKFLKENILQAVSKKFNYSEDSREYLLESKQQLIRVISFIDETLGYLDEVKSIKEKENEKV